MKITTWAGLGVILTLLCAGGARAANHDYCGIVCDRETGQSLANVYVEINGKVVAVSDRGGAFSFNHPGTLRVPARFRLLGFEPAEHSLSPARDERSGCADTVWLTPEPLVVDGIVVTANANRNAPASSPSTVAIDSDNLEHSPGSWNDPSRVVQMLPSVTIVNDYRADLVVRGGNPAEGVVLVEGFEVANINHFGTQGSTGGPFGMIPADNIKEIEFSPGAISVRYPNRLSSAMSIKLKGAEETSSGGKLRADLTGFGGSFNLSERGRGYYLLATARRSYLDILESQLNLPSVPIYGDALVKAGTRLSGNQVLSVLALYGYDRFVLAESELYWDEGNLNDNQDQVLVGIKYSWLPQLQSLLEASYSFNYNLYDVAYSLHGSPGDYHNSLIERTQRLALDYSYQLPGGNRFNCGLYVKHMDGDYLLTILRYKDDYGQTHPSQHLDDALAINEVGGYLEFTQRFGERATVRAGARYDRQSISDDVLISPRLLATYELTPKLKLSASAGRYGQAPSPLWLVSDPANRGLPYFRNNQAEIGLEWLPALRTSLRLAAYRKLYENYPTTRAGSYRPIVDYGTDFKYYDTRRISEAGYGYARGIELTIQQSWPPQLEILCGGALFTSHYDASFWHYTGAFDTEYTLSLSMSWRVQPWLEIGLRYVGDGGHPDTPIDAETSAYEGYTIYDFDKIYQSQLPPYQRLDLRLSYYQQLGGNTQVEFYVDVLNILDRDNIYRYYWDSDTQSIEALYQWQILPITGLLLEW